MHRPREYVPISVAQQPPDWNGSYASIARNYSNVRSAKGYRPHINTLKLSGKMAPPAFSADQLLLHTECAAIDVLSKKNRQFALPPKTFSAFPAAECDFGRKSTATGESETGPTVDE